MTDRSLSTDSPQPEDRPLRIGTVTLAVRDLEAVARFYREAIGLEVLSSEPGVLTLGAGSEPLLVLRHDPQARPDSPREAGLFHIALRVPTGADLGCWLMHAAGAGIRLQGAADHDVSEAIYLADPEGNGLEVYADRPADSWSWQDGIVAMGSRSLDVDAILRRAVGHAWTGMPAGTTVGHIHLRVGEIGPAEAFYAGRFGLAVTRRRGDATFYASGGYHHHVATNVWNSRGAGRRPAGLAGLAGFEIVARDEAAWSALKERVPEAGAAGMEDPWGNRVTLRRA